MSELPATWSRVPLSEIASPAEQRVPADSERFRYIDIASVDRERKVIGDTQELTGANAPSRARKVVRAGDVVVSMTRPNLNAVALVPPELDGQIASTGFEVLRPKGVDPRWLYYLVRSQAFVDAMSSLVQGALYPAVRSKDVRGFVAPLAPLPEQKRIADKLDRLLAAVDTCKARLDAIPDILKRFRRSVLAAAVSGKLTAEWRRAHQPDQRYFDRLESVLVPLQARMEEKTVAKGDPSVAVGALYGDVEALGWRYYSLQQLVDQARGIPYGIVQTGSAQAQGIPTVRAGDIKDFSIDVKHLKLVSSEVSAQYARTVLAGGEVLLAIRGSVGSAAIAPPELAGGNISREVAMIPPIEHVDGAYIVYVISSPRGQEMIGAQIRGVAQAGINLADLRKLVVPLPTIDEQREIVRRVDRLLEVGKELQMRVDASRASVDRICEGLLAKAFRGEVLRSTQKAVISPQRPASNQTRHFARAVLSAEIVHRLHAEPTFGRVKHQKIFHLCEHIAQLQEIGGQYHRDAAGPLDNKLVYANESELKKQKWYAEFPRPNGGHGYRPLSRAGQHRKYAESYWPDKLEQVERLIELMRPWSTERCEIFSTCYAVWNDFIISGKEVDDDLLVSEILENWHPAKRRISEQRWRAAIKWMRERGFAPVGFGRCTRAVGAA